jgi:hypothetical protein
MENNLMGKKYTIKVGDKSYSIPVPKFLSGDKETKTSAPVSIGHAVEAKTNRKNQLDEIERQLNDVGKSDMEKEVFDD